MYHVIQRCLYPCKRPWSTYLLGGHRLGFGHSANVVLYGGCKCKVMVARIKALPQHHSVRQCQRETVPHLLKGCGLHTLCALLRGMAQL